ncbi:phospho-N-acetylmuramoyl-pentapeptide-transferase, partial [Streptococcus suis]
MQFKILSGVVAFILTVILIQRFITFYKAKRIEGQQMHEDVKPH